MEAAAEAITKIKTINFLAPSPTAGRMASPRINIIQSVRLSSKPETLSLHAPTRPSSISFPSHQRAPFPTSRSNTLFLTRCSTKPGVDSNNATNRNNPPIELGSTSAPQPLATTPSPNQSLTPTCSRGLVFDLGPKCSWDSSEIGSPIVKRFIGDNEERWYMWYHGRSSESNINSISDSIGLAVSSNGIHWARGADIVRSCADAGMVMNCRNNWWAFDTHTIQPSEMVIMSSPMYSAVYWLYYTGATSEEVIITHPKDPSRALAKAYKSLPGLACSQDGRNWARIEGDHHSGALLDVGSANEWDSAFIAGAHVVIHNSDDLRMYYHSFDRENGHYGIGMARSRDGIRWVKMGKIMGGGSVGSFDEFGVKSPCVVRKNRGGSNYLMAYEGVGADGKRSIGLAESCDGLKDWKRVQNGPVLEASSEEGCWDCEGVGSPCLVQMDGNGDKWRLYYVGVGEGGKTGIGMATTTTRTKGRDHGKVFRRWEGNNQLQD